MASVISQNGPAYYCDTINTLCQMIVIAFGMLEEMQYTILLCC